MRNIKLILIMLFLLLLSACSESDILAVNSDNQSEITTDDLRDALNEINNDMSNYPTGVQNGSVSIEYYNAIATYLNGIDDYVIETNNLRNNKTYSTEERFKKQVDINNDKIVMINSIVTSPANEIEREIEDYFFDTLYYDENATNYLSKYLTTNDKSYRSLMESSLNSYNQKAEVFNKILKKYKIVE